MAEEIDTKKEVKKSAGVKDGPFQKVEEEPSSSD
jgi:hypothetical protein